jgi:hypothetical protein
MYLDDEQLDAAIDETARRMTAAPPDREFRRRVMARIDRQRTRRVLWPVIATASAAAVLATAVVIVRWNGSPLPEHARPPTDASAVTREAEPGNRSEPVEKPPVNLALGGAEPVDGPSPTRGTRKMAPTTRAHAIDSSDPTADLRPFDDVERLTMEPIRLEAIDVSDLPTQDSLTLEPLPPTAPLAVVPLGAEDQGDRR